MSALDRAVGALLGLACGDAVGTTLEFKRPGTFTPIDDMVGGGPFRLEAGQWTDDTSMALCLAESILDTGDLDLEDQLRRYLLWRDTGYLSSNGRCFDIGTTTSSQLERFRRTRRGRRSAREGGLRGERLAHEAGGGPDPLACRPRGRVRSERGDEPHDSRSTPAGR